MEDEKRVNEPAAAYVAPVDQIVSKPIVLERDGKPVLVLMPYEEYQRLQRIEMDAQARKEFARRNLGALMDELRSRPTGLTEEEIEAIVTEEVHAVREERRARHRAMVQAQSSILELQGLGKEIWQNIDAQAYIDQERTSWNG
jgi:PHD/YefM family antitoxin component YafN of YafNO toxin-antitoxin module